MLKKFFAATLGLLMLSSQIVSAKDIDWDSAPRIGSKVEFARYIESERRKGQTVFNIVLINGFGFDEYQDIFKFAVSQFINYVKIERQDDTTMRMHYEITEYPGTIIANAYLEEGEYKSWLDFTDDEKKLYNLAIDIIYEADKRPSELEKARYIFKAICNRVEAYEALKNPDGKVKSSTAIDALVYRKTHCEGFTDAFYMLGRMCGLNVGRIAGEYKGESHGWNFITFADGKSYCVDVTNGFNTKSYYLFCATKERMWENYSCEWEIIPNLQ